MIPLKDENPSGSFPIVTLGIVVACALTFGYEVLLAGRLERFIADHAVIPRHYLPPHLMDVPLMDGLLKPLISSMFLHGGLLHLVGNMWYLWIFGDNVEDRLGHFRFLLFYLACGLAATLCHIVFNSRSSLPVIGASGAIAGVLGAYVVMFPKARVQVLIPLFWFYWEVIPIPAVFMLGAWFVLQFANGVFGVVASAESAGVAWWAHVGGFAAGLALIWFIPKRKRRRVVRYVRPGEASLRW